MKVTTEDNVKEFILNGIKRVYIGFDDNTKVKLDKIIDYDIDLDRIDCSTIGFTNALNDIEIENHFGDNNHVIYVHIEALGILPDSERKIIDVFYDIPCDMKIKRFRMNGDINICQNVFIELEGIVK